MKKIILFISLCINCFLTSYIYYSIPKEIVYEREKTELIYTNRNMSNWEIFTMALMEVESRYDSTAYNEGAYGYFQITPIYVEEVNNQHNTNYTMQDVINLEKAYEIFDLMQQTHNQDYDIEKAIILHNGKHDWYRQRIMNSIKEIKKYEEVRNRLIEKWENTEQKK